MGLRLAFGRRSPPRVRCSLLAALLALVGVSGWSTTARAAAVVVEDFEDVSDWNGLEAESTLVQQGSGAGHWPDVVDRTSIRKQFDPPLDLSGPDHLGFWMHSAVANGQTMQLVFMSDDAATSGSDYYSTALTLDWSGWRWIWLDKADLGASRSPIGWHEIQSVSFSADGWSHTPLADTDVTLDYMVVADGVVTDVDRTQAWSGSDFVYTWVIELTEPDGAPLGVDVACSAASGLGVNVAPTHVDLPASGVDYVAVEVTLPASVIAAGPYQTHEVTFTVTHGSGGLEGWHELVANPPAPQSHPRVLLTEDDFTRIATWAADNAWAQNRRDRIIARADGWPADFLADYGLGSVALPPEGGQWGMHYVCPTHGVNLAYEPPMTHSCPVDGQQFSGWPYDQVIYARQHNDLASAARDAGLAYQLTGNATYAQAAAQILLDYAAAYAGYPLHDTQGGLGGSSARVLSQTLDESGWLVKMAWAYDLVAASGELSAAEQTQVEQELLRASAATVMRHDAGRSNWQAWHNAGIAAAGRAVGDPRLVAHAISGPSGFHYHMAESVLSDGFWYEGSWGYHFYTLSPMTYLAEMGERAELDLYSDPALQSMYTAPILFAPPDLVLPAFNDSGAVNLRGSAGWRLDAAYRAYGDPYLVLPLLGETRDEEALFWGAETVPTEAPAVTESLIFDASGFAVLRGGTVDDPWYLALDYGPHGGWHGHYDKLGYVFFARGEMLAIDPGSHSYALPLHDTWDKSTLAHNTVTVDETDQVEATGESHVTDSATLDFSDWQEAAFDVDGSWSHWGGNDDGVIDLPLDSLALQLDHETGGAAVGDVYVDDWRLTFPSSGEVVVEDYERLVAQELVWVKGATDTTYVVGEGIGPDLTMPVPYA
ncbi:MAG: alginate lyase family protein, partial [Deltaproteobacteria bacterium]|nr:alginate lyase family protein [Deltaproteobacteria bacterium]MBW2531233.1 alginate lyase family protein [Deltaproteobacteria bacterium]